MSDNKSIADALDLLQDVQNVSFLHPIKIQKLIDDKTLGEKFLTLKFTNRSRVTFHAINYEDVKDAVGFIITLREKFPYLSIGNLVLKFDAEAHWDDHEAACRDFARAQDAIVYSRQAGVRLELKKLGRRLDTPYYHLFEELHN